MLWSSWDERAAGDFRWCENEGSTAAQASHYPDNPARWVKSRKEDTAVTTTAAAPREAASHTLFHLLHTPVRKKGRNPFFVDEE